MSKTAAVNESTHARRKMAEDVQPLSRRSDECGRGIFLIRQFMDEVDFRFSNGTEVRMRRAQNWQTTQVPPGTTRS